MARTPRILASILLSTLALVTIARAAHAQTAHRSQVTVSGLDSALGAHEYTRGLTRRARKEKISSVAVRGSLKSEGPFRAVFSIRRNLAPNATVRNGFAVLAERPYPLLLQGFVHTSRGSQPATLSIIRTRRERELSITFPGKQKGTSGKIRTVELSANLARDGALTVGVHRVPPSASSAHTCASELASDSTGNTDGQPRPTVAHTNLRVLELATDADSEWYATYGDASNEKILSIVNQIEPIYERDLGVTIEVTKQNVFASATDSPYTATDAGLLLDQFVHYSEETNHLDHRDTAHLFTGKNLEGSTVGIAYVGVVCSSGGSFSYGLSQHVSDTIDSQIAAHEIGHNLKASHDATDAYSIMAPAVRNPASSYFSEFSKGEITAYIAASATCLDSVTGDPSPAVTPSPTVAAPPPLPTDPTPVPSIPPTVGPSPTAPKSKGTPTPQPTSIPTASPNPSRLTLTAERISKDRIRFVGSARDGNGYPMSNATLVVTRNGRPIFLRHSDAFGVFVFRYRLLRPGARFQIESVESPSVVSAPMVITREWMRATAQEPAKNLPK